MAERDNLKKTNPKVILDYIKNSIDILIEIKVEEKIEAWKKQYLEDDEDKQNEYEPLLKKLESDIRQHIRVSYSLLLDGTSIKASLRNPPTTN